MKPKQIKDVLESFIEQAAIVLQHPEGLNSLQLANVEGSLHTALHLLGRLEEPRWVKITKRLQILVEQTYENERLQNG